MLATLVSNVTNKHMILWSDLFVNIGFVYCFGKYVRRPVFILSLCTMNKEITPDSEIERMLLDSDHKDGDFESGIDEDIRPTKIDREI